MDPNCLQSLKTACLLVAVMVAINPPCSAAIATMVTTNTTTKQGCPRECGNVTIPYPFGIGLESGCSLNPFYDVFCNLSSNPPTPFLLQRSQILHFPNEFRQPLLSEVDVFEILEITEIHIRIRNPHVAILCYNFSFAQAANYFRPMSLSDDSPFSFSSTSNRLVGIGCEYTATVDNHFGTRSSCSSTCSSAMDVTGGQCDGHSGCCEAPIPAGSTTLNILLYGHSNSSTVMSFSTCGYSFVAEEGWYNFGGLKDFNDPHFPARVMDTVPLVLDWVILNGPCMYAHENQFAYSECLHAALLNPFTYETCAEAMRNPSTYACMENTTCYDQLEYATGGYKCSCIPGFEGNPYLSPGCSDIDECADPNHGNCSMLCYNTQGSFHCSCPSGYTGDGRKSGSGCTRKSSQLLKLGLGISSGFLLLLTSLSLLYIMDRKRQLIKKKKIFFQQNGGWLLKEQLSMTNFDCIEPTNIFTEQELKASTNGFDKACVIGTGGYGIVYKGVLPQNNRIVAIKKSKMVDQNQIEQFINELVILGQINHRNVVKLLGCCLETEVPLLVYEFISNGTLHSHIHGSQDETQVRWHLKWRDCLRIASEAANALAYLHSAASPPIIHRDIKSMNILLDDDYTAKIADFGASRLIPMDQSKLPTIVQGTLGYLDPEYLHSSLLTDKSDVYSFGVVLAELLTRQKPFSRFRPEVDRNLATYFVRSFEEGGLFDILDPEWVSEGSTSELVSMASIARSCLQLSGRDRPTMREVSIELEAIRKVQKQLQIQQQQPSRSRSENNIGSQDVNEEMSETTTLSRSLKQLQIQHQQQPSIGTHSTVSAR